MNGYVDALNLFSLRLLCLLPVTSLKSALVFAAAFALVKLLKRLHPRTKYRLWVIFFAGLVILPVFSMLADSCDVRIPRAIRNERASQSLMRIAAPLAIDLQTDTSVTRPSRVLPGKPALRLGLETRMPLAGLCVLLFGVYVSSLRLCAGALRLAGLKRNARPLEASSCGSLIGELCGATGIGGNVSILLSERCRVPFTCGVFRPLVFFPPDFLLWPKERLKAVLRHEFIHVKQGDCAVKLFARSACSLFWFIPFVWVAYANLCAEQEQACDASIVESGMSPARYARDLIQIARSARGQLLASCIFVTKQKRSLLKKRISNLLELKGANKIMKKKTVLYACAFLVALLVGFGNFADAEKMGGIYVPEANEEFYGTWVNMKHTGVAMWPQKMVIHHWGYYEGFYKADSTAPSFRGTSTFVDKWTDSNGDVWYKTIDREDWTSMKVEFAYYRISENGSVMEFIWNFEDYPDMEDLEAKYLSAHYRIFFRQ